MSPDDEAITAIWTIVDALNGYITENEPWALAKDDAQRARLGTVLYTAAEGLRALAVLLSPVMPESTEKLWIALGAAESIGRLREVRRGRQRVRRRLVGAHRNEIEDREPHSSVNANARARLPAICHREAATACRNTSSSMAGV